MRVLRDITAPGELERCRQNFIRQGGAGGPRTSFKNGDGHMVASYPARAYYLARQQHPPEDKEWWDDQHKRYPELRVPYQPRNNVVWGGSVFGSGPQTARHRMTERAARHPGGKLAEILSTGQAPTAPTPRVQE